jgi:hypothetical protein
MLTPGQKAGLDRDRAVRILEELQRLQRSDRRYRETVEQLRAILNRLDHDAGSVRANQPQG